MEKARSLGCAPRRFVFTGWLQLRARSLLNQAAGALLRQTGARRQAAMGLLSAVRLSRLRDDGGPFVFAEPAFLHQLIHHMRHGGDILPMIPPRPITGGELL